MALGGRISEFDVHGNSTWEEYVERIELYCAVNKVLEAVDKRAVLLSCCGQEAYSLISTLVKPLRPPNVEYQVLIDTVQNHIQPKPSELYSRYVFSKRDQEFGESVADYVTALRRLAGNCGFGGDKFPLTEMLRDRLVFGIADGVAQQRLLAEKKLTFEAAYDLAVTAETTAKQHQAISERRREAEAQLEMTAEVGSRAKVPNAENHGSQRVAGTWEQGERRCFRCLGNHAAVRCRFKNAKCFKCSGKGHIERACKANKTQAQDQLAQTTGDTGTEYDSLFSIGQVASAVPKYVVDVEIGGENVKMEVDSGAARSIISQREFQKLVVSKRGKLEEPDTQLVTWTKEGIEILGKAVVPVKFKGQNSELPLLVVKNDGNTLLGRDWFGPLKIEVMGLHSVSRSREIFAARFPQVFSGSLPGAFLPPIHIELKDGALPKFLKCRNIPFALKEDVVTELNRLKQLGILEPTQYSEWATPIVVVRKKDGSLRICGDYRSTVNQAVKSNVYPLPTSKELFAKLGKGRFFSKLDLAQAYQQLVVDDTTAELLTINTVQGLYKVRRLPYGVSVAPGLFQRAMDTILAGLPKVAVYLDDILVVSETAKEHERMLTDVFERLAKAGLRVQANKCELFQESLEFLGHRIDKCGIYPSEVKVEAIHKAPAPTNKKELQAFLGMVNFYNIFFCGEDPK